MPVSFTCPHCGASTVVADQFVGSSGPCGQCGRTITIPGTPGTAPFATPRRTNSLVWILALVGAAVLICPCGMALLLPAVQNARESGRRAVCLNNLRNLGLAMQAYEQQYGCFPPAYVADANGTPMHSWRVLLLPFLERQDLYRDYKFDEPWNGPHNSKLASTHVELFGCPSDPPNHAGFAHTNYALVTGPGTMFEGDKCIRVSGIRDGTANTIMIVEISGSDIPWTEPRDLDIDQLAPRINDAGQTAISSYHPGGANVVFVDGHVRFLSENTPPDLLQALITVKGDEAIGEIP